METAQSQVYDDKQKGKELVSQQMRKNDDGISHQTYSSHVMQSLYYSFNIINRFFPSMQSNDQQSTHPPTSTNQSSFQPSSFLFTIHQSPRILLSESHKQQLKGNSIKPSFQASKFSEFPPSLMMICRFIDDLHSVLIHHKITDALFEQVYSIVCNSK